MASEQLGHRGGKATMDSVSVNEHGRVPIKLYLTKNSAAAGCGWQATRLPTPALDNVFEMMYFLNLKVFIQMFTRDGFTMSGMYIKWVKVYLCPTKIRCKTKIQSKKQDIFAF